MEYRHQVGRHPLAPGEFIFLEYINWKYQSDIAGPKFLMLKITGQKYRDFSSTKNKPKHPLNTCVTEKSHTRTKTSFPAPMENSVSTGVCVNSGFSLSQFIRLVSDSQTARFFTCKPTTSQQGWQLPHTVCLCMSERQQMLRGL